MDTTPTRNQLIQYDQLAVITKFLNQEELDQVNLDSDETDFYLSISEYVCNAIQAKGGVLWCPDNDEIQLINSFGPAFENVDFESDEFAGHVDLAFAAMEQASCSIVDTERFARELGHQVDIGRFEFANLTHLFIPFLQNGESVAVLAALVDQETCPISIAELIIVTQRIELILARRGHYEAALIHETIEDRNAEFKQLKILQDNVSRNLDVKQNAFDVVNEIRAFLGTGRVTLCQFRGTTCQVNGVSGQAVFNKRSPILKHIKSLAQLAGRSRKAIYMPDDGESLPESIKSKFQRYFETADTRSIALIPLIKKQEPSVDPNDMAAVIRDRDAKPGKVVGVIAIEGLDRILDRETLATKWESCENVVTHSVANSHQYNSFFLMPIWRRLGQVAELFRGHHRNKAILATLGAVVLIAAMTLIQADFRISCTGTIQPSERAQIFAEVDGVVDDIRVRDGDEVHKGELLARLSNPELESQYFEIEGQLAATEIAFKTLMRQRNINTYDKKTRQEKRQYESERAELIQQASTMDAKLGSLKRQLELINIQRSKLEIRSPRDGVVMTWNVKKRLAQRPVKSGDLLMMIAAPNENWELELRVPDRRAGYMIQAWESRADDACQKVTYCLASNPEVKHNATLREIASQADVDGKVGNVVRAYADIPVGDSDIFAKPGTEVLAHIHAGRRSIGYCKLYEFIDWTKRSWFRYVN